MQRRASLADTIRALLELLDDRPLRRTVEQRIRACNNGRRIGRHLLSRSGYCFDFGALAREWQKPAIRVAASQPIVPAHRRDAMTRLS